MFIIGPSADIEIEDVKKFLLKNKIGNVEVVGPVYGSDKSRFLLESDVFVLPTFIKMSVFPVTILEAFQAGMAVISTKNGAIPDMVVNGVNGYLLERSQANELADKMLYLINNKGVLRKIKLNNIQEYKESIPRKSLSIIS